MSGSIQRFCVTTEFTAPSSAAGNGFNFGSSSAGQVRVPSGSSITSLTWYCGDTVGGPWYAVQDGSGNAVTSTIAAGNSCLIPAACFACHWLLPVGNAAGTINLDLKS